MDDVTAPGPTPGPDAERRAEDEVLACFHAYEAALLAGDADQLDGWFWDDPRIVRFGIAECQHGPEEIAAWRRSGPGVSPDRRHVRTTATAHGPDVVVVALEFADGDAPHRGRQSQVWARTPDGWRVVHAHVSTIA